GRPSFCAQQGTPAIRGPQGLQIRLQDLFRDRSPGIPGRRKYAHRPGLSNDAASRSRNQTSFPDSGRTREAGKIGLSPSTTDLTFFALDFPVTRKATALAALIVLPLRDTLFWPESGWVATTQCWGASQSSI